MHLKAARRIISGSVWVLIASHKWQLYKKLLGHPGFTKTIHTTNDPLVKQSFNKKKLKVLDVKMVQVTMHNMRCARCAN